MFARELKKQNKRVFLDYKYHDIEETVRNAVARAADLGVDFLTVHGVSGILVERSPAAALLQLGFFA